MYKAVFKMSSWLGVEELKYESESLSGIVDQLLMKQNLYCLVVNGYEFEDKKGIAQIKKLEKFLQKFDEGILTQNDFEKLDISLSIGSIRCVKIELY